MSRITYVSRLPRSRSFRFRSSSCHSRVPTVKKTRSSVPPSGRVDVFVVTTMSRTTTDRSGNRGGKSAASQTTPAVWWESLPWSSQIPMDPR